MARAWRKENTVEPRRSFINIGEKPDGKLREKIAPRDTPKTCLSTMILDDIDEMKALEGKRARMP